MENREKISILHKNYPSFAGQTSATALRLRAPATGLDEKLATRELAPPEIRKALDLIEQLPEPERRIALRKLIRERQAELRKLDRAHEEKSQLAEREIKILNSVQQIHDWSKNSSLNFEKASADFYFDFQRSLATGHVDRFRLTDHILAPTEQFSSEIVKKSEVFVIQHDWASVLSNASEVCNSPFNLPYEVCAFCFRIGEKPCVFFSAEVDTRIMLLPAVKLSRWVLLDMIYERFDGGWLCDVPEMRFKFVDRAGEQIRAACIALDAEVASADIQRHPHEGIVGKNSHLPLPTYRVVTLSRQSPRHSAPNFSADTFSRKKRLHFRRGHWRHFTHFKTWIRWTLVGDPDLGFVDKEYRL